MPEIKNLNDARALIAELSAQVGEIASLREQASQVEALQSELAEIKSSFEDYRIKSEGKYNEVFEGGLILGEKLESAQAEVAKLQAEAKSAELRALEITGNIGGAPLPVSENADERLTVSDVVSAINAEKDPVKKGLLFKQYQKLQRK